MFKPVGGVPTVQTARPRKLRVLPETLSLKVTLQLADARKQKARKKPARNLRRWSPQNEAKYRDQLDASLQPVLDSLNIEELHAQLEHRCKQIESILVDVGQKCNCNAEAEADEDDGPHSRLHSLIDQRRTTCNPAK